MKIKISLDDPEIRAVWETAKKARAEVAGWPAWKRGEDYAPAPTYYFLENVRSCEVERVQCATRQAASDAAMLKWPGDPVYLHSALEWELRAPWTEAMYLVNRGMERAGDALHCRQTAAKHLAEAMSAITELYNTIILDPAT